MVEIQATEEMQTRGGERTTQSRTGHGSYFGLPSEDHLREVFKTKDMMLLAVTVLGQPRLRQQLRR